MNQCLLLRRRGGGWLSETGARKQEGQEKESWYFHKTRGL
jgi:hypothetical protein